MDVNKKVSFDGAVTQRCDERHGTCLAMASNIASSIPYHYAQATAAPSADRRQPRGISLSVYGSILEASALEPRQKLG